MSKAWRYSVKYLRDNAPLSRVYRRTVTALTADEARAEVARLDAHYLSTVQSPQRRAAVTVEAGK